MLEKYLEVGGNEVVNSARAYGYATTSDCPATWIIDPECNTLADAQSELAYTIANINAAPWYDPDDAELTSRFLGVSGLSIAGLSDSTRTATNQEKTDDGSVVSGYRHGSREVRVRAWLTAAGEDALEYGNTWLRNVLEPDACGVHGGACGEADSAFFVTCPPARRNVVYYSDWTLDRTNLCPNPSLETNSTGWAVAGTGNLTRRTDGGYVGLAYGRATSTSAVSFRATGPTTPVVPGDVVTLSAYVKGVGARSIRLEARYVGGPANMVSPSIPLPAGWTRMDLTVTVPAGATAVSLDIDCLTGGATGDYFDFDAVLYEKSGLGDYFDGATADDPSAEPMYRYSWTGTVDNSASTREIRTSYVGPEGDETYHPYVNGYRRFIHSVRCISGPFEVSSRKSSNGVHYGRLVEFTLLAQVPFIFGMPVELDIPPIVPTVVQDIAYNLVPYPSAELPGAAVVVATNYSTNPSVEANNTGWASIAGSPIVAGNMTGGRVTGELAAVGPSSYRTVFTAPGAGAGGYIGNQQDVALGGGANARYSVNIWSAAVIMAGAPVMTPIEVRAIWTTTAGGASLRTDLLGTIPVAGGPLSAKSIAPPAGAAFVTIQARLPFTSYAAGNVVRLYSDALAVTTP